MNVGNTMCSMPLISAMTSTTLNVMLLLLMQSKQEELYCVPIIAVAKYKIYRNGCLLLYLAKINIKIHLNNKNQYCVEKPCFNIVTMLTTMMDKQALNQYMSLFNS